LIPRKKNPLLNLRINTEETFGTSLALEDVLRRDLTINSLFYNINTSKVEDWTEKGLLDIKNKVCRTPLSPLETFMSDPFIMLRTIRFANRFDFSI